jgi:hypothetical protein
MLFISAEINAHDLAVFEFLDEASHTVGIAFGIYPAGPGASSLRENQNGLIPFQQGVALVKGLFHLLAVPAAVDRNAFSQVTYNCQEDISLEIIPFRQIPGKQSEMQQMTGQ